jgi:hypothetical protein
LGTLRTAMHTATTTMYGFKRIAFQAIVVARLDVC